MPGALTTYCALYRVKIVSTAPPRFSMKMTIKSKRACELAQISRAAVHGRSAPRPANSARSRKPNTHASNKTALKIPAKIDCDAASSRTAVALSCSAAINQDKVSRALI